MEKYTEVVTLKEVATVIESESYRKDDRFVFKVDEILSIEKLFGTKDQYAMTFIGKILD